MAKKKNKAVKTKSGNIIFGLTSRVLMTIVAVLLVLSYASIVVNPAKFWFISITGLLFVPLSIVNLLLLLWAVKRKSRSFVIPLMALLPAFFFVGRYVQTDTRQEQEKRQSHVGETIKVMTYNVGRFMLHDSDAGISSKKQCADSVFAYIRSQNPDIVCLQEVYVDDANKVRKELAAKLPGYNAEYYMFPMKKGAFGNVTLSRMKVASKGKIKFDESANLAIYTDYSYKGRHFRVYNCHFESYNISLYGLLRSLTDRDRQMITDTGTKMKRSITRRPKQVDKVFSDIESCPVEAFVCGDFNDNPMSYTYYRMTRGRKDAFVEAGNGLGATFSQLWPMLRIDYVLFPDRFHARTHSIPRLPYSDHYPVVTEIVL